MMYPTPVRPLAPPPRQGTGLVGLVIFLVITIPAVIAFVWVLHTAYAWADCGATGGQALVLAITRGAPDALRCMAVAVQH